MVLKLVNANTQLSLMMVVVATETCRNIESFLINLNL
jgi:hypothetical protein